MSLFISVLIVRQSCFSYFLTAKELLLISLLSKVKLGLFFGHAHLFFAFPVPTILCEFILFLFPVSGFFSGFEFYSGHVSSNEINEGLCNFD